MKGLSSWAYVIDCQVPDQISPTAVFLLQSLLVRGHFYFGFSLMYLTIIVKELRGLLGIGKAAYRNWVETIFKAWSCLQFIFLKTLLTASESSKNRHFVVKSLKISHT